MFEIRLAKLCNISPSGRNPRESLFVRDKRPDQGSDASIGDPHGLKMARSLMLYLVGL